MGKISKKTKLLIADRAQHCCEYCLSQAKFSPDYFSIEHIIPSIKQGSDQISNLAYACLACNNHKFTATDSLDPLTGLEAQLYHPRQDEWNLHFRWNENLSILVGISPTGRATIERLCLNREAVVNLRSLLAAVGKHPPF
ncbi:HNH endonuclease [Haliscomenobacter hydrossis]|uniref:HNH nuclease n=1 Tax=Haliscomenobacter hydrossis (strain ATCC 27775 / DSM 1100 / LMG 10767 / O) TaxID=760192 RepID=F4KYH3_HALH1|nr:HNH endonuclease [Haliscomenobacter hydrossis]AEE49414.1 HNH nuclease [Haliscomenobacter hydrossis DSM 1100]